MEQDLVDILLATYNSDIEYLKLQIDSILCQTYKNIHLIISDDASTQQNVKDVLKEYEQKDSRIEVFLNEKNVGYINNFEFLLKKSNAKYIAFADHDDIWYENKIEECIKALKEENVDLVYSDCHQIDEKGKILNESYLKYKNMPIINGKNNILAFSRHIAIGCSTVFTSQIKDQMLPFSQNVMAHDWLNVYLASKQNGIACIEKPLFGYRIHSSNEFGGRSLNQNLNKWKSENENSNKYNVFKKYRKERVINKAYLSGSKMCLEYRDKLNLHKDERENKVINYYNKLLKSNVINFKFITYNKYLSFKGIGKRKIKEIMIFHFPIISYIVYRFK
ncbi:MAG: glycosyltransferase [Clostridia bacterium]|nr:glycosyltransferase [Clostridia bacterium]